MDKLEEFLSECYNKITSEPLIYASEGSIDITDFHNSWKKLEECDKSKLSGIFDNLNDDYTTYLKKYRGDKSEYKVLLYYLILTRKYYVILSDLLGFKYHYEPDPDGDKVDKRVRDDLVLDKNYEWYIIRTLVFKYLDEYYEYRPEAPDGNFFNLPTSAPLTLFNDIIGSGKSLPALPARKRTYNHSAADELQVGRTAAGKTAIVQTKGQSKTTIILDTLDSLAHNAHQRKIARHILRLANEQCFFNGIMSRFTVEFPLDDLIGDSLYMTNDTARVGFVRAMAALQAPAIVGYITKKSRAGKEEKIEQAKLANLFVQSEITNNICRVWLNPFLNWNFLLQYFTIIPSYYMQLTDKASDLLEHIFIQARQNEAAIKAGKPFNISFRSICYKLGIPTEEEVKTNPKYQRNYLKHIVKPLNDAIEELIAKKDKGYSITVHSSGYSPSNISEYLNTGYLEIAIKEDSSYYDPLTKMISRKEQFIQESIEKQERKEINTAVIMKERAEKKKKK